MTKATRPSKPRTDRGARHCMVLELENADHERLQLLVERYQKLLGGAAKANKALVIRQLIRSAAKLRQLPAVQE